MKIFYLAHDLDDPAISRRATQLKLGGAQLKLAGFRRRSPAEALPEDVVVELGRTADGRLAQRALTVFATAMRVASWGRKARGNDVLVARGLEMLVLGALVRLAYCRHTPLVYECLDIHRLMVVDGPMGRILRRIEGRLLRDCSLLITSSPAFITNHFVRAYQSLPPVLVWENKMLARELGEDRLAIRPGNRPPWRIGWFGIIRCARSLDLLQDLCQSLPGQVQVEIRGRPTKDMLPKLDQAVASTPGLTYGGPYDRSRDLANMYGRVHFTWAVDFFEDGANSAWLLPNRLYEGPAHKAVPIALGSVETGRWLARNGFGVLLGHPVEKDLLAFFQGLDSEAYRRLLVSLAAVDPRAFCQPDEELFDIVAQLSNLSPQALRKGCAKRHEQSA